MVKIVSMIKFIFSMLRCLYIKILYGVKFKKIGRNVNIEIQGKLSVGHGVILKNNVNIIVEKDAELRIGNDVFIGDNTFIKCYGGKIFIGDSVSINNNCHFNGSGDINIGKYCRLGPRTSIVSSNHNFDRILSVPIKDQGTTSKGVNIGDNIWFGINSTILDGVNIKSHCVFGAGALVNKNVNICGLYVGSPIKLVREFIDDN